jgi:hypothetical protein
MPRILQVLIMLNLLAAVPPSLHAATLPSPEFLQDAGVIQVKVAELGEWAKEAGLTAGAIEQKVAFVLRAANLRVANEADGDVLLVRAHGMSARIGNRYYGTFYTVTLELMQYTSQIGSQKLLHAITWRSDDRGVSPDERTLQQDILQSAESQAQALANAIHAAKGR